MPQAGVPASLPEPVQTSRDIDLSPGQPLQSNQRTGNLGVIGRNSTDLGPVGDNFIALTAHSGGVRDQLYNLQMLEAAHLKLPQPKDSERPRTYTPVYFFGFNNPHFTLILYYVFLDYKSKFSLFSRYAETSYDNSS